MQEENRPAHVLSQEGAVLSASAQLSVPASCKLVKQFNERNGKDEFSVSWLFLDTLGLPFIPVEVRK